MSLPFIPPTHDHTRRWLTVDEAARIWNRSPRHIRRWCIDGTFISIGARLYRNRHSWYIGISPSQLPTDLADTPASFA